MPPPSSGHTTTTFPSSSPELPSPPLPPTSAAAHLHPEDAYITANPYTAANGITNGASFPRPRNVRKSSPLGRSDTITPATVNGTKAESTVGGRTRVRGEKRRNRDGTSGSRKRGTWKKLLWVKQAYPDNYTDELQFLSHLQRNPQLRPYEFWPLVADSTIIVQHVASVIIFVCCFVGIFQERVSPVSVVSWATSGTVLGWIARDYWIGKEESQRLERGSERNGPAQEGDQGSDEVDQTGDYALSTVPSNVSVAGSDSLGISFATGTAPSTRVTSRATSVISMAALAESNLRASTPATNNTSPRQDQDVWSHEATPYPSDPSFPSAEVSPVRHSTRNSERLATAKSAILIYCALLGLSPILKSLTKSTSPDSIWAMSSWLIIINVFTFDYGAGVEAKFPAPLSTNAALMASTVLASRLPSTTHVFSLTLFSIEVFGLFPVFRRHLRHVSRGGHLALTAALIVAAGGGLCVIITGGGWRAALVGIVLGGALTCLAMGMTSWWLIGLQRYKNEITGPWDPARPVIRRRWD